MSRVSSSFPSHFPAFRRILVDPFGNICIFPYYQPEDAPVSFDMFSSKGNFLGKIRIAGEQPPRQRDDVHLPFAQRDRFPQFVLAQELVKTAFIE